MSKLTEQSMKQSHAIVIGGSMAGMFAARVLSDFFEQVTVLDRDTFPEEPEHRHGVPQSQHAHALLERGQQIIERHFPGLTDELMSHGATKVYGDEFVLIAPYGKLASVDQEDDSAGFFVSRFMLEWFIRERLREFENITLYDEVDVQGLLSNPSNRQVQGIVVAEKGAKTHQLPTELKADFVVDASGRRSKAPQWLASMGYDMPPEEIINSQIGYASRFYRKPKNFSAKWKGLIINARVPDNPRAGLILPIENDLWHVTLGGFGGHYPPTDEQGFMQWAKDLPDPMMYEALKQGIPITPLRGYRTPSNRLRHFEQLEKTPEGFIAIGDSVCAFNPIYGQGMTISAIGSMVLHDVLTAQATNPQGNFEKRFQTALAKQVADPWFIATSEDLRWKGVELQGAQPSQLAATMRPYINQLLKVARNDKIVSLAYFDMINLLRRPQSLFRPNIVARVLLGSLRGQMGPNHTVKVPTRLNTNSV